MEERDSSQITIRESVILIVDFTYFRRYIDDNQQIVISQSPIYDDRMLEKGISAAFYLLVIEFLML